MFNSWFAFDRSNLSHTATRAKVHKNLARSISVTLRLGNAAANPIIVPAVARSWRQNLINKSARESTLCLPLRRHCLKPLGHPSN